MKEPLNNHAEDLEIRLNNKNFYVKQVPFSKNNKIKKRTKKITMPKQPTKKISANIPVLWMDMLDERAEREIISRTQAIKYAIRMYCECIFSLNPGAKQRTEKVQ